MRTLIVILGLCTLLAGCGGEEAETSHAGHDHDQGNGDVEEPDTQVSDDPIVGSWEIVAVLEGEDIDNTGSIYTFAANGDMTIEGRWTNEGSYFPSDSSIIPSRRLAVGLPGS